MCKTDLQCPATGYDLEAGAVTFACRFKQAELADRDKN